MTMKGKTVWLTGASSGIGQALAVRLAQAGSAVVVSARSEEPLQQLAQQYPKQITSFPCDVANFEARKSIAQSLGEMVDQIDVVIMAAGVAEYENDLSFSMDMYQKVFSVNFFGAINTIAIAMPFLKKASGRAHIVGVSSLSVVVGFPRAEAYGSSKAALEYFLNSLRTDLDPRKFDVSIIRPGFVKTPMTDKNDFPMPFLMTADEAANRIFRAVNRPRRLFAFPKRFSFLLCLFSWLPGLWYRYIGPKLSRQ